ncbi:unnamed protein product [Durusdinium trenchii]|uniref:Acyltransferase 3 domain-containing protein n=1 Tax=Durusdinium trenchii TaxID=1381693 RepID=A0ABP0HTL0_9DINO
MTMYCNGPVHAWRGRRGTVLVVLATASAWSLLSQCCTFAVPQARGKLLDATGTDVYAHGAELGMQEPKFSSRTSFVAAGALLAATTASVERLKLQHRMAAESSETEAAPPKPKKVRITAFDSIRFFLIAYIVCGHFITFAAPGPFALKAISQINVVVGAFFALSGYVAAYTTTENAERAASPKLLNTPPPKWFLQRVFGYYPLHLLVLLLFSPMFLFSDVTFSGWPTAIWHGFLSAGMLQAWFPMHAEVWNAPTWFLSALTFAMAALPFALPVLAKQSKSELRRTGLVLFFIGLLPKLGYCYDHQAWGMLEGAMSPKAMPNLAIFNMQRFNPFYALIEVLLGAVACRLVMLDGAKGEEKAPKTNVLSTLVPLLGMVAVVVLRAMGVLELSDLLTRALVFIPLFLYFLMSAHRASVLPEVKDGVVKCLGSKFLVALGNLAFPIFVVHGPIGQVFYKKVIATKLFGGTMLAVVGPQFFYAYLAIVLVAAWVLQKAFLTNKQVSSLSSKAVEKLSKLFGSS